MTAAVAAPRNERLFTPAIVGLAAVVVLGTVMTILDATIVNVAVARLGAHFSTSISTIQWVATAYLLAFAAVIPATGWASERFGARRVWLTSLGAFVAGSVLAGASWSIGSLIAFRVLQGAAAGMILPLGQTLLAQAAGPHRMGRIMSVIGVPMLLAPIFGPVVGGAIVDNASWRWIFFVNVPVGAVAFALALRLLPRSEAPGRVPLDARGLALLAGGIAVAVFGLSEIGTRGTILDAVPLASVASGLALVTLFVVHALRTSRPLIDVRLFSERGFATAAATNFLLGTALFGILLLLPLYFQLVRGESPLATGLLLVPQGLGAACAMPVAGALVDRVGAGRVVPAGIVLALAGCAAYTQIGATTSFWYLAGALFLVGLGLGSTIMPSMAAAYQGLAHEAVPRATSALNAIQRVAGSLGTALLAVVLQRAMRHELPGFDGGLGAAGRLVARNHAAAGPLATAFGLTFWAALALAVVALVPALLLPRRAASDDPAAR
jgi:EmrB/QacA subfamily drug resistance transporter